MTEQPDNKAISSITINLQPDVSEVATDPADIAQTKMTIKKLVIKNDADYVRGGEFLRSCRAKIKAIEAFFDPLMKPVNTALKVLRDRRASLLSPWESAHESLKDALAEYAVARKKALDQAEIDAEEARVNARARLREDAIRLTKEGKIQEAEAKYREADEVDTDLSISIPERLPDVDGLTPRRVWKVDSVDMATLIQAIAKGEVRLTYSLPTPKKKTGEVDILTVNETALERIAARTKGAIKIPGVTFKVDYSFSVSSKDEDE